MGECKKSPLFTYTNITKIKFTEFLVGLYQGWESLWNSVKEIVKKADLSIEDVEFLDSDEFIERVFQDY